MNRGQHNAKEECHKSKKIYSRALGCLRDSATRTSSGALTALMVSFGQYQRAVKNSPKRTRYNYQKPDGKEEV